MSASGGSIHETVRDPKSAGAGAGGAAPAPVSTAGQQKSEEEYGFAHPAASRPQRTVWIPRDEMGLGEEEARGCGEAGVGCSLEGARMDGRGKVEISGAPPDLVGEE